MKKILFFSLLLILALLLISCSGGEPEVKTYRVMVSLGDGASVVGENPVEVRAGESAVFQMQIEDGYVYVSSDGGTYSHEDGTLTVSKVTKNMNVDFVTAERTFDENEKYVYVFKGASSLDSSSVAPGGEVNAGTKIKLTAGDDTRFFLGWSLNYSIDGGGSILSSKKEYEFILLPELTKNGVLTIYANYLSADTIYYHAAGGEINTSSPNMTARQYYTVSAGGETVSLQYKEEYLDYFECASSFYDDGTFTKEGYVLKEYNTRPDGSGISYSLGSKVPMMTDGYGTTLYCIWAKDSEHSDFTYKDITIPLPGGLSRDHAPHWVESGVIITGYSGNDTVVTIPETIGGKTVIAIDTGAFVNKQLEELVMGRRIIEVRDGAFVGCDKITTVYYPDGIYYISDAAFDDASYKSFKNFYVNATIAPRYNSSDVGALAVKLSRLLASESMNRIIVISGSSSLQGLGTEYLEALLGGKTRVINFGTTRTTHGTLYLEAMGALAHEGDIIVYAPENSAYMFGERELYYKTFRDLEGMVNIYRYVDFSNYRGMFSSMSALNRGDEKRRGRYEETPKSYECICAHGELLLENPKYKSATTNKYGDFLKDVRVGLIEDYHDTYFITMNNRVKSRYELESGSIYDDSQIENKDYTDLNNKTWASIDDEYYREIMNFAIARAKSSGAGVYFGFCPVDASALVDGADETEWLLKYDELIDNIYDFDGRIGSAKDYIFDHSYFYDSAFHPNDYGRVYRTYQLYLDLSSLLDLADIKDLREVGESFEGCLFEDGDGNEPNIPWTPKS